MNLSGPTADIELLARLERAVRWSDKFTLIFVKCNHSAQREALSCRLAERLVDLRVVTIELREPIVSLREQIETRRVGEKAPAAIQVLGLEHSINNQGDDAPVLGRLNHDRDLIRRRLHGALVIWLPDLALDCIARGAPDFWAWRSGVYEIRTDSSLWQMESSRIWETAGDQEAASLPVEEKRREISRIEELLRSARAIPVQDRRTQQVVGRLLNRLGVLHWSLGEVREAINCFEQRLEIARKIGDRSGEGNAVGGLSLAYSSLWDARKAVGYSEQWLEIARELDDVSGIGNALGNLGIAHSTMGDQSKAIGYFEQSMEMHRESGNRQGVIASLTNLGISYAELGDNPKAIEYYEQALQIAREVGDRFGEGTILGSLGNTYLALGDSGKAIGFLEQRLKIAHEIGDRRGEGVALGNIGNVHANMGDERKAIVYYERQLEISREIGDRYGEANALWNSAQS